MAYHNSPEAHYDHLMDVEMRDAATARELSGYSPDGINDDFTVSEIAARTGNIALSEFVTELSPPSTTDLHQKGGLNHAAWLTANQDPTQASRNQEGIAKLQLINERNKKAE